MHENTVPLPFARVLLTGADGFVGQHLGPRLAERLPPGALLVLAGRVGGPRAYPGDWREFDLVTPESVSKLVSEITPDLVVHLAGQASVGASAHAGRATWALNFGGAFHLASAIADHAPQSTMLFVSTAEVYGRAFNRGRATEETLPEPLSAYARSKAAAELMLADVLPSTVRLLTVRPSNHTGPGQTNAFVAPAFAEQVAKAERAGSGVVDVGNLDAERDFLDVRDVVEAYLALLARANDLGRREVLNLASGRTIRIAVILERLIALSRINVEVRFDPSRGRPSEVPRADVDARRFRDISGWSPQRTLDETIADVLEDCRKR